MFTRLLWKEFRVFWPIWLSVAIGGAAIQALVAATLSQEYRYVSDYLSIALCFTLVYATAVASAAFAAEREANTLGLLDAFGLRRRTLWLAKAGFAMASTLLMVLTLVGLAVVVSPGSPWGRDIRPVGLILSMGSMLVVHLVAWGLFWSSRVKTSLTAAVATILTALVLSIGLLNRADDRYESGTSLLPQIAWWHISYGMFALPALVGSYQTMKRGPHHRSIAEVALDAESSPAVSIAPRPIVKGRSIGFTRLLWSTYRENLWAWVAGVAFLGLLGFWWMKSAPLNVHMDGPLTFMVTFCAGLCAGVNLFGSENRRGRRRFLAAHGAHPSAIWLAKILPPLLLFAPVLAVALNLRVSPDRLWLDASTRDGNIMAFANAFAVSAVLGMLCERGITALALSTVTAILLLFPQAFLASKSIIEPWQYAMVPLAVLAVGWAWRYDWLLERPGAGKWLRLARHLAIATVVLLVSLMIHRATSIGALDAYAADLDLRPQAAISPEFDARTVFRRIGEEARIRQPSALLPPPRDDLPIDRTIADGWTRRSEELRPWLKANDSILALLREASKKEHLSANEDVARRRMDEDIPSTDVLLVDARERESRKDLQGAWDSLETAVRLARLMQGRQPLLVASQGIDREIRATRLMMDWAFTPGQTVDGIKRALAAYRALPPPPQASDAVKVEIQQFRDTVLPGRKAWEDEQKRILWSLETGSQYWRNAFASVVADAFHRLPSEQERSRRLDLMQSLLFLSEVDMPPRLFAANRQLRQHFYLRRSGQTTNWWISDDQLADFRSNTRTDHAWWPDYGYSQSVRECEVTRAALPLAFAAAAYRIQHGRDAVLAGDVVETKVIDHVPLDPYSGKAFEYNPLLPLRRTKPLTAIGNTYVYLTAPPERTRYVISSIGLNLQSEWDRESQSLVPRDDIEFPLP